MIATAYIILFILAVMAIIYPEDFPKMIRNPQMLGWAVGVETRRRWMILKFGSILWVEKKKLQYSLWRAQPIIEVERLKQKQQQEETND